MDENDEPSEWQVLWNARLAALEKEFGVSEGEIATSLIPIYMGGQPDVLTFKNHVPGVTYVSAGMIGDVGQQPTNLGEYELAICLREANDWAPTLLSQLAAYTLETPLQDRETMDIASAMPEGSSIVAFLFVGYRRIRVGPKNAGVLLCLGITKSELVDCRKNGPDRVLDELKKKSVFPYTDLKRKSVI